MTLVGGNRRRAAEEADVGAGLLAEGGKGKRGASRTKMKGVASQEDHRTTEVPSGITPV